MDLVRISLTNFRNFSFETEVDLPKNGLLVAAAPNAVGKTNFLESVAMLLRGKTWRARAEECVKWGENSFLLEGEVERQGNDDSHVAVRYHKPTKKIRIEEDGVPASVVSFYSHYPFVLFVPEDTFLLSRGPAQRRNFANHVLVSHPGYVSSLVQYHRVLRQRNIALKRASSQADITAWTELLVEHADIVWRHREGLVSFWSERVNEMYRRLSGEAREFDIQLACGVSDRSDFLEELNKAFRIERRYGYTAYGPHRDDIVVLVEDRPAVTALSRGQLKSLVVSLKVLSHRYVKQLTKEEPLLLLDDVLSELDEERQTALIENLPKTQTILTCTALPEALEDRSGVYLLDLRSIVQVERGESEKRGMEGVKEESRIEKGYGKEAEKEVEPEKKGEKITI